MNEDVVGRVIQSRRQQEDERMGNNPDSGASLHFLLAMIMMTMMLIGRNVTERRVVCRGSRAVKVCIIQKILFTPHMDTFAGTTCVCVCVPDDIYVAEVMAGRRQFEEESI